MDTRDCIIIGGGATGLATAYYLQKKAQQAGVELGCTLLEGSNRLGGKIVTERTDGFVIEGGPDCFLNQKPWAAQLCRELGLGDELIGTNDARRKVFVVNRGRLTPLPDGVMLIVPTKITPFLSSELISWPGKLRMGLDVLIPPRRSNGDESVGGFVRRRLGQEALDKIAEPLMSGIHVSDPDKQSLLGAFPRFRDLELKHGSLIRGMLSARRAARHSTAPAPKPSSLFISLRGGLGQLVESLEQALDATQVVRGTRALSVVHEGGLYRIVDSEGRVWRTRAVVAATPASVSASLLSSVAPDLAEMLGAIRYVSTATVSLAYDAAQRHLLNGFGFVLPRREQRTVSACTWTTTKFQHRAPDDAVLLRAFVGGPGHEADVDLDDAELVRRVREDLARLMGLQALPRLARVFRWPQANPQYDVGHMDRLAEMNRLCAAQPGLHIAGSAYGGVGVPDCVRQGQDAAGKVFAFLQPDQAADPPSRR